MKVLRYFISFWFLLVSIFATSQREDTLFEHKNDHFISNHFIILPDTQYYKTVFLNLMITTNDTIINRNYTDTISTILSEENDSVIMFKCRPSFDKLAQMIFSKKCRPEHFRSKGNDYFDLKYDKIRKKLFVIDKYKIKDWLLPIIEQAQRCMSKEEREFGALVDFYSDLFREEYLDIILLKWLFEDIRAMFAYKYNILPLKDTVRYSLRFIDESNDTTFIKMLVNELSKKSQDITYKVSNANMLEMIADFIRIFDKNISLKEIPLPEYSLEQYVLLKIDKDNSLISKKAFYRSFSKQKNNFRITIRDEFIELLPR